MALLIQHLGKKDFLSSQVAYGNEKCRGISIKTSIGANAEQIGNIFYRAPRGVSQLDQLDEVTDNSPLTMKKKQHYLGSTPRQHDVLKAISMA